MPRIAGRSPSPALLPAGYDIGTGKIVDSTGQSSRQVDLIIYHRASIPPDHERIGQQYIYSMAYSDDYEVTQFNVMLEIRDVDARPFKVLAGLKYLPTERRLSLITLF